MEDFFGVLLAVIAYIVFWVIMPTVLEAKSLTSEKIPERLKDMVLVRKREPNQRNATMNYFIAGLFNQPKSAFSFLDEHNYHSKRVGNLYKPVFLTNGPLGAECFNGEGITYVPYHFDGDDFEVIAECIRLDIVQNGYKKVRIFGISVGCKVIRYFNNVARCDLKRCTKDVVERQSRVRTDPHNRMARCESAKITTAITGLPESNLAGVDISCYEINPCWTPMFLKPKLKKSLKLAATSLTVFDHLVMGWFGFIPIIRQSGNWFSLRQADCLLRYIAYDQNTGCLITKPSDTNEARINSGATLTKAVIISQDDEFLDNHQIENYYSGKVPIYKVDTTHGNTIGEATRYYLAFQKIRRKEKR